MLSPKIGRVVLQRAVSCSGRTVVSVVLIERCVQLMSGRSQMLLNPVVKQVLVTDGILVNHPVVNSPAKSVALMLNTVVLSPTKMLDSAEVLRVSQVLSTTEVLGAAKMLSPTHVNAMTSAEPANVPTHMATADMAATRVSPAAMTVAGLQARSCQNKKTGGNNKWEQAVHDQDSCWTWAGFSVTTDIVSFQSASPHIVSLPDLRTFNQDSSKNNRTPDRSSPDGFAEKVLLLDCGDLSGLKVDVTSRNPTHLRFLFCAVTCNSRSATRISPD